MTTTSQTTASGMTEGQSREILYKEMGRRVDAIGGAVRRDNTGPW